MKSKKLIIPVLVLIFGFLVMSFSANMQTTFPKKGDVAPELEFNSPDGVPIKLSSLRGKMVLIDFWASWCRPCRYANPHLVKLYQKYKDQKFVTGEKGFTIYSLSLDQKKSKQKWINAIAKDGLVWKYHVSDLKGWSSAGAKRYGVRSIPQTFLIDGKGVIIGKFMNHRDVDLILSQRLKKK